jgi:hypothetical protein
MLSTGLHFASESTPRQIVGKPLPPHHAASEGREFAGA